MTETMSNVIFSESDYLTTTETPEMTTETTTTTIFVNVEPRADAPEATTETDLSTRIEAYWSSEPRRSPDYVQVARGTLLSDSVNLLMSRRPADLGADKIRVLFLGEAGIGDGVHIEWISSCAEAFFSNSNLFVDKEAYKIFGPSYDDRVYAAIGRIPLCLKFRLESFCLFTIGPQF